MHTATILWVDLRFKRNAPSNSHLISQEWQVRHLEPPLEVSPFFSGIVPTIIVFEFDKLGILALSTLSKLSQQFMAIPVLILTEYHSEALAVWALRSHVSNYLVVPISSQELTYHIKEAITIQKTINSTPTELRFYRAKTQKTASAVDYIQAHFQEKILEEWVADICNLSISTFSRTFRKEQGKTFREYLLKYRLNKAIELLCIPNTNITDIAFTVGFNDASYFSRMFKQIVKQTPTEFQQKNTSYRQKNYS